MRQFPQLSELPTFVGDTITQICFAPYGVRFSFESSAEINAEFGVEQIEPDGTRYVYDCAAWSGPPLALHRVINQPIGDVNRSDFCLLFRFNQGSSLSILSDEGPYESGQIITDGGTGTVVF